MRHRTSRRDLLRTTGKPSGLTQVDEGSVQKMLVFNRPLTDDERFRMGRYLEN